MAYNKVAVIGAGIIGEALIGMLLKSGFEKDTVFTSEKRPDRLIEILDKYRIQELRSIEEVDVLFLAVKPQDFSSILSQWKESEIAGKLVVSFAAGIKTHSVNEILGNSVRVIRVMPNTPMTVGRGILAMSLSQNASQEDQKWLGEVLGEVGEVISVPEELQDAVTATSGSGPAYFFAFTEAIEAAAKRLGLNESHSKILARETLIGAALMVEKSGKELKTLRENVTSPNGTTAAALKKFETSGLEELVYEAMKAAQERSIELSS
jgi:pyrroline-5-carboxylate reductase